MAELQLALTRERIPLELRVGGELAHGMVERMSQDELETIAQGPPGARWILLEAPFLGFGPAFHDAADELRERGFGVVIGHPERSARLGEDLAPLRHEVLYGSALQVNVWTIAGRHGEEARDIALRLVREGLATVVASDAHADWRRPLISRAIVDLEHAGHRQDDRARGWPLLGRGACSRLVCGGVGWSFRRRRSRPAPRACSPWGSKR